MITAMQDLRVDLEESIISGKEALKEIENEFVRNACVMTLEKTINSIINRIDTELLAMEKKQLIGFGYSQIQYIDAEIGDLIYKKVPEEIFEETYTHPNQSKRIN